MCGIEHTVVALTATMFCGIPVLQCPNSLPLSLIVDINPCSETQI
jgi:hypothetical protein